MLPPVFALVKGVAAMQAVFGSSPMRVYPFGLAPQRSALPYAVWEIIDGESEAYLNDTPDIDHFVLQFSVYGDTPPALELAAIALRDILETVGVISSWDTVGGQQATGFDETAGRYRASFVFDWLVER